MQRYCWHYLYNSSTGRTALERDDSHIYLTLPNVINKTEDQYVFTLDERDQRTLVAFDGYLLAGSPNRKGACIFREVIGVIQVPRGQFYMPKSDELGVAPYKYLVGGKQGEYVEWLVGG